MTYKNHKKTEVVSNLWQLRKILIFSIQRVERQRTKFRLKIRSEVEVTTETPSICIPTGSSSCCPQEHMSVKE